MESARRKVAHDEMASRIYQEWRSELRKAEQKETDDVVNARVGRSL
jgi:flagellar biosynthesis chaperone FliJ